MHGYYYYCGVAALYMHTHMCIRSIILANYICYNHMVNTFYPIENSAITNKLLLRYKTRLKSPKQEKIT